MNQELDSTVYLHEPKVTCMLAWKGNNMRKASNMAQTLLHCNLAVGRAAQQLTQDSWNLFHVELVCCIKLYTDKEAKKTENACRNPQQPAKEELVRCWDREQHGSATNSCLLAVHTCPTYTQTLTVCSHWFAVNPLTLTSHGGAQQQSCRRLGLRAAWVCDCQLSFHCHSNEWKPGTGLTWSSPDQSPCLASRWLGWLLW